jgi:hypothetical protein
MSALDPNPHRICEKCSRATNGHRLCGRCWSAEREIAAYNHGYRDGLEAGRREALQQQEQQTCE